MARNKVDICARVQSAGALGLGFFIVALSVCVVSCTTPQVTATFAEAAGNALGEGPLIFQDLHESCVRRHIDAQPITPVFLSQPGSNTTSRSSDEPPVCARLGRDADALTKVSDVLGDYFQALQQLAAFDTSSVSGATEQAAENAATAANLGAVEVDSIGKLAQFVTRAFTDRYRQRHLLDDLHQADASISSVTKAFETIVSRDYEGLLDEEQQTLAARYQDIGDSSDKAVTLLLNRAYEDELNGINRRRAAANAYVTALQQVRAGHHELAENARHMHGKDLSIAIAPFTSHLQASAAAIQKGF